LSAPPLMGRTAIISIALAALAVSAHGVPVTSAHARSKTAGSQTFHHAPTRQNLSHRRAANTPAHPHEKTATSHRPATAARHTPAQPTAQPAAHKPTPAEVGRTAGLKIRSQLAANKRSLAASRTAPRTPDRQAVSRRYAHQGRQPRRSQPELVRASYTPAIAARPYAEDASVDTVDDQPSRQTEVVTMSGATHYEAVDAEPEASRSAGTSRSRKTPAYPADDLASNNSSANTRTSILGAEADLRRPSAPVPAARRNTVPQPTSPVASSDGSDDTDSSIDDTDPAAPPAARNAVHPSFARHVAVPLPATDLDDHTPETMPHATENSNDYNISEDKRLKAETEEASLNIARGYMPAPLRGNRASLERQNERLEAEGLERIEDEQDLAARIAHHLLVPVPVSGQLAINTNLPINHRYCRPWTARFLSDLAAAHYAQFHRPLQVSSAVRTVEYQKRLMQVNGNAAPAEGDVVSPHLTGATIDIAKDNLSRAEMAWMRRYLLAREAEGKIDVEEEFQQSCFHIAVYKNYLPAYHPAPSLPSQAHTGRPKHRPVPTQAVDEAPAQGF